jgi:hypothetical protein
MNSASDLVQREGVFLVALVSACFDWIQSCEGSKGMNHLGEGWCAHEWAGCLTDRFNLAADDNLGFVAVVFPGKLRENPPRIVQAVFVVDVEFVGSMHEVLGSSYTLGISGGNGQEEAGVHSVASGFDVILAGGFPSVSGAAVDASESNGALDSDSTLYHGLGDGFAERFFITHASPQT